MLSLKRLITGTAVLAMALTVAAGPLEEGKSLYRAGDYEAAVEQLRTAVRRTPRDGNANYYLGASLVALGDLAEARPYLEKAAERGVADAYPMLVAGDIELYDTEAASTHLDAWRARLRRNRSAVPAQLDEFAAKLVKMRNMLVRVEQIEVLDSINVPAADFFRYYRLSAPAGKLLPPQSVSRLIGSAPDIHTGVAFMPENRTEMLWAQADSTEVMQLYGAGILDDGTAEPGTPLDSDLGEGGSAAFPFLMPDGMTLYFANNGANSLGGYDIFMTRREHSDDGNTYFQPQNIGMPYNSPFNDYMLAIDENSGLGWFASDRNQIPDSVTVFIFVPAETRVNVDASNPNLVALAKLSDIAITRRPGTDAAAVLASRLPEESGSGREASSSFVLDMGNGRIYTKLSDFRNPAARSAMVEYLGFRSAFNRHLQAEQELRSRYAAGDRSLERQILDSEHETELQRRTLKEMRNAVIRQEQ